MKKKIKIFAYRLFFLGVLSLVTISCKESIVPESVPFTEIAIGEFYSLAIKSDGTLWAWGHNKYGQLGIGGGLDEAHIPVLIVTVTQQLQQPNFIPWH